MVEFPILRNKKAGSGWKFGLKPIVLRKDTQITKMIQYGHLTANIR